MLDDAYIKRFVLEELGNIESKEALAKIISNTTKDKNEFLRRTSLSIIEKRAITFEFISDLQGFAKDQDGHIRKLATNCLKEILSK